MITGVVTADREGVIRLRVRDPSGEEQEVQAVVDTGFTGWLTLSPMTIAALGLDWRRRSRAFLADGSEIEFRTFEATVMWNGKPRRIPVDEAETTLLVGMALLEGHELRMQCAEGGRVEIEELPGTEKSDG